jgi:hypothetical protein
MEKISLTILLASVALASAPLATAQSLTLPQSVEAGSAFSIPSSGSGKTTLYIVGPGQAIKRVVDLGTPTDFPAGSLYGAGRYAVFLAGGGQGGVFDVVPSKTVADLSFLAKPSRLPVGLHDGITGAVYVFDTYRNLITAPLSVSFELSAAGGAVQNRTVTTHYGAAWTAMDSTAHEGKDQFIARLGNTTSTRIVGQVPGDPCGLRLSAKPAGAKVALSTEPVRDCSGNAVPDGTIVTFTERYPGGQSTVDVPLKRGIAEIEMPNHSGATVSVASGVVMGNQIGLGK